MIIILSCEKEIIIDKVLEHRYINKTDCNIFTITATNVGSDSAYIKPNDSLSLFFINSVMRKISLLANLANDFDDFPKFINGRFLYNLTDTTMFMFLTEDEHELIKIKYQLGTKKQMYTQYITDDFLTLFKKDRKNMLNRFKEYYTDN